MELVLSPQSTPETYLLQLIASYLKLEERGRLKLLYLSEGAIKAVEQGTLPLKVPSLVTEKGEVLTDVLLISRHLVSLQPLWTTFFLGNTEEEKTQITNIKAQYKQGKDLRKNLQKHLQSRTFFVGNHLTLADLYMFTQLYDNVTGLTDQQKLQYNNIFRWYKHIQNLQEVTAFLKSQNRLIVADPEVKISFLQVKKQKKGKKEQKKEQAKKEQVKKQ